MAKRWSVIRVLAVVAVACILVALVVRFAAVPAFENSPDHAHIAVTNVQPQQSGTTTAVIFDQQVSQEAGAIYRQLTSGADVTGKLMSCPAVLAYIPYYRYVLTFTRDGMKVATATNDARGCAVFTVEHLDGSTAFFSWTDEHGTCFWDDLHELVNAPEPINLDTGTLCGADNAFHSVSRSTWAGY